MKTTFWLGAAVNLEPCETPETIVIDDDASVCA